MNHVRVLPHNSGFIVIGEDGNIPTHGYLFGITLTPTCVVTLKQRVCQHRGGWVFYVNMWLKNNWLFNLNYFFIALISFYGCFLKWLIVGMVVVVLVVYMIFLLVVPECLDRVLLCLMSCSLLSMNGSVFLTRSGVAGYELIYSGIIWWKQMRHIFDRIA